MSVRVRGRQENDDGEEAPEPRRMRLELLEIGEPLCVQSVFGIKSTGLSNASGSANSHDNQMDIAEMFTPPRVTLRARSRKLRGGWSMDCDHTDPTTGRRWDLSNESDIKAAWKLFFKTKPKLLIVPHHAQLSHRFNT